MKKTISAGGVVVGPRKKILITNQNNNSWSLPKGHVDVDENLLEAAKREIYEETGVRPCKLKVIKELGKYERFRISRNGKDEDGKELKTIHIFLFKTNQLKLCPLDKHHPEARWVAKNEVANMLTHNRDKEFFKSIMGELP